ncbi:male sterility [Fusarium sporotrichioides]|uniref:gluconokinase n=1 Tax=Fusarium sporotrichioides TaxID=5514 RepID=A0A395RTM8_FUSSP|nr:male sterility [Fusarium sporotrichioides]
MPATIYVSSPLEGLSKETEVTVRSSPVVRPQDINDSQLRTIDGLIRHRASLYPHDHVVSYPSSGTNYVDYTLQQLDIFAWRVAKHYEADLPIRQSSNQKPTVVAMLGPSNLEYLITMLALNKLGHTALLLSTRIPQIAVESLVNATGATTILADGRFSELAENVSDSISTLTALPIAGREVFEYSIDAHGDTQLDGHLDPDIETENIAWIIHSSGSTGLPKPILQTQKSCLPNYAIHMDMKSFITLPLFHNHGICNMFRAIHSRKAIHLYNADLPLTQHHLVNIMREHSFEIFYGVPYALKLLCETQEGIDLLRSLKVVMYGGSACPDDLGNLLVDNGVHLVGHYGATEVGQLMTSFRPQGDKAWNYVRENDKVGSFLKWVPRGRNLYECCVTDGWPAKVQSNQPDNSYATKDLFEPHPSIPRAWKYIARMDDTLVLVNGEKFNPVAMEGSIRSNRNVKEAIVFGAGRPYLGLLVVPSEMWAGKPESDILEALWPTIELCNRSADSFASISKSMVKLLPWDCEYPRTDKGSVIRQACYKNFKQIIDDAYDSQDLQEGNLQAMELPELKRFIQGLLVKSLSLAEAPADDVDFFALGLDSLQAILMRSEIHKTVQLGNNKLGQNVVFENPSIEQLSQFLLGLRLETGQAVYKTATIEEDMAQILDKYTTFKKANYSSVITGATGSLGAHVVAKLTSNPSVSTVYCLVRASDETQALYRVKESMVERKVYHSLSLEVRRKIIALPSDLSDARLGLASDRYTLIAANLQSVIHCAWSVNFNMQLSSFEKGNIAGVKHLIDLCQAAGPSASMNFCSSVSTCSRSTVIPVPERAPPFEWAQPMGYAQSKSVSENLCAKAAEAGITTRVLRIGQIVADTQHGIWNAQEGVPMMIQTATTIGALPKLKETPSWLPVDTVADAVVDISLSDSPSVFTNIANPKTFDWTSDLLPALRNAGLAFDELSPKEWLQRLRASNPDPTANPPIKLVDFFASKYDKDEFSPSKPFATEKASDLSPAIANVTVLDQEFVNKFVKYFSHSSWKVATKTCSKTAVVVAGPCGSGKSTIGSAVSSALGIPFIEGDSLHTRKAVEGMRSGTPLVETDRMQWLERVCARARETLLDLEYESVAISCSALAAVYRATIRKQLKEHGINVIFLDLQASAETLTKRLEAREGHYMSSSLVMGQVELHEVANQEETDVFPIDSEAEKEMVIEEALWFLSKRVLI